MDWQSVGRNCKGHYTNRRMLGRAWQGVFKSHRAQGEGDSHTKSYKWRCHAGRVAQDGAAEGSWANGQALLEEEASHAMQC